MNEPLVPPFPLFHLGLEGAPPTNICSWILCIFVYVCPCVCSCTYAFMYSLECVSSSLWLCVLMCVSICVCKTLYCVAEIWGFHLIYWKFLGWVAEPQSLKGPICELYIIKCLSYLVTVSCQNLVHLLQIIYHIHNLDKIVKEGIFYFALENYWLKFLVLWLIVSGARHFAVCNNKHSRSLLNVCFTSAKDLVEECSQLKEFLTKCFKTMLQVPRLSCQIAFSRWMTFFIFFWLIYSPVDTVILWLEVIFLKSMSMCSNGQGMVSWQ